MASTIRIAILANGTQAKREFKDVSNAAEKSGKRIKDATRNFARITGVISSYASVIGPATTGILAAGKAVAFLGRTLASTGATAAAFAPSVAGAFALVKGTALIAAPAIVKAFEPVIAQFRATDKETGALAKRVQDLAAKGLKPLAEQFVKVNLPTIGAAMGRIATAMNGVIVSTGKWLNSTPGQALIRTISEATASAMERLGPKLSAVVIAFGNLANRAGDKAITGLADVIGRILDRITEWANSTSTEDIKNNLSDLAGFGQKVKDAFDFLKDVGRWMQENQGKVKALSDAFAILGIALAIFAGGPVMAAVFGVFTLLINHWEDVKRVFSGAAEWWNGIWSQVSNSPQFKSLVTTAKSSFDAIWKALQPVFQSIRENVVPALQELLKVIIEDVIPAIEGWLKAITPIYVFLIEKLGPVVGVVFGAIVKVISGALKIISGIINAVAGIITGDWGRFWNGIKQILSGAWGIIKTVVSTAWEAVKAIFSTAIGGVVKIASGIGGRIKTGLGNLAGLLVQAGKDVIQGLINGIKQMAGRAVDAAKGVVGDAVNGAKRLLGIASPSKVFRQIGRFSGEGLAIGLKDSGKKVQAAANDLLSIPSTQTARVTMQQSVDLNAQAAALQNNNAVTLVFDSSGNDELGGAIFEYMRKRVRTVGGGNVQIALGR